MDRICVFHYYNSVYRSQVSLQDYSIDNKLRKYMFQTHPGYYMLAYTATNNNHTHYRYNGS